MPQSDDLGSALRDAEVESLKLAARGRLVVTLVLAVYALLLYDGSLLLNTLSYIGIFMALALCLLLVTGSRFDRPWVVYLFVLLEVTVLTEALFTPNPYNPEPWPPAMIFRQDNFHYYLLLIALAVFSYRPLLVLWVGLCSAVAWGAGVAWLIAGRSVATYQSLGPFAEGGAALAAYLDPNVVNVNGRIKEIIVALLLAALLATVVWRGRSGVTKLVRLGEERRALERLFGRYVPAEISAELLRDDGWLTPERRTATVLFADIEGFTSQVEDMAPEAALEMLNEYFAAASEVIARHGGVVTQFQGDAILASFNVPVPLPDHEARAVKSAVELLALVREREFAGRRLHIRIGVNSGTVVAGSVGGPRRVFYTVHGDAVNVAARLEAMNKEHGTRLLVSGVARDRLGDIVATRWVGSLSLSGRATKTEVYEVLADGRETGDASAVP